MAHKNATGDLDTAELVQLVRTAFSPRPADHQLGLLVDLPDEQVPDTSAWRARRELAWDWFQKLSGAADQLGLEKIRLFGYANVHSNNADLPDFFFELNENPADLHASGLPGAGSRIPRDEALAQVQIVLAPTQFSATAPLKLLAKRLGFRAATMPGFSREMIPALRLDWEEIDRRVRLVQSLLSSASAAEIEFDVMGMEPVRLSLDLRYRQAHASGGRFPEPGVAGNLPSGESYIVPYEGERGEPSRSGGILPVQFGDEVVLYRVENNRAVEVISNGPQAERERKKLAEEPAYGNLAELGFGVLADFGVEPIGEVLLDEKLGLHIAFGRSDHFGGATSPASFKRPENVVHIDRIYIPQTQPEVRVRSVRLMSGGEEREIMCDGSYLIF